MTKGERIRITRESKGISQTDLALACGVKKQTLYKYENDIITNIPSDKIELIAERLGVTAAYIMGWETSPDTLPSNIQHLQFVKFIPLVGTIACGTPIFAEENIERRILLPDEINAEFALRCKGDSMINAGIEDGDIVYIRQQDIVDNGDIAAVQITDYETEATLKKVYQTPDSITLVAENSSFAPMTFTGNDVEKVRIIGKCVAVLKKYE